MAASFIEPQPRQPVIGLALGGGGLRGTAHLGVLEVLRSKGLSIDMAAGTSAGSIIAMLHALGWTPQEMENLLAEIKIRDYVDHVINIQSLTLIGIKTILDRLSLPHRWLPPTPLGFVRGRKFYRLLRRLSGKRNFYEIDFPLFITATNLCDGQLVCFCPPRFAGQLGPQRPEIIFTADASLAQAVRASTAIPGIFEPMIGRPYACRWSLKNNVPADLLRWAGADIIIAVIWDSIPKTVMR